MASSEPLFLTSRLLSAAGVVHGFSVRAGGVSRGPWESLNLSDAVGDEPQAVQENLRRLTRAAGARDGFVTLRQVHGDRLLGAGRDGSLREVFAPTDPSGSAQASGESNAPGEPGDALVALEPGTAVAVRVADCVPVLLYAGDGAAVAAVHSGWRGARLSVAGRGVRALQHVFGADPGRVLAAVGPSIGRCCYEVSAELAGLFRGLFGPGVADDPAAVEKPHLDLRACVSAALVEAGVPRDRIEQVGGCTACETGTHFSHRRDRGRTGRHLAFVVAPGERPNPLP